MFSSQSASLKAAAKLQREKSVMIRSIQFHANYISQNPSSSSSSSSSKFCSHQIPTSNNHRILPSPLKSQNSSPFSLKRPHCFKPLLGFCSASFGRRNGERDGDGDGADRFLQASLLFSGSIIDIFLCLMAVLMFQLGHALREIW